MTNSVLLQYRNEESWTTLRYFNQTDRAVEVDIELSNNSDHLQLRWIQDNSELNPAWAIDDIYLECDPGGLDTLLSFEEDKEILNRYWECYSGNISNTAATCSATELHLMMDGSEREARTRVFNITSSIPPDSITITSSTCRKCLLDMVSNIDWPASYVGTELLFSCNITPAVNITRTCQFDGSSALWQPSAVDVFNVCRTGLPPAGASCNREEIRNMQWPEIPIGSEVTRYCIQNRNRIRRRCVYNGSAPYWQPNNITVSQMCPEGRPVISERVAELGNRVADVSADEGISLLANFTTSSPTYNMSNDLQQITELMGTILDKISGTVSKEFSQKFGSVVSSLLEGEALVAAMNLPEEDRINFTLSVLTQTDDFALKYHSSESEDVNKDNLRVTAVEVGPSANKTTKVFSVEGNGEISLDPKIFTNSTTRVGGVLYYNLSDFFVDILDENGSNYTLESSVFSVTLGDLVIPADADSVVEFNITHRTPGNGEAPVCAFYNLSSDGNYKPFWSQAGCEQLNSTDMYTICRCNHLTHFAVLFDTSGTSSKISTAHETALKVITYVGVAVSLPCLLVTVVCFLVLKALWSLRTFVHINLCCTLFIAQLIFVVGADKTSNEAGCATIAILLHYFFLTTFMWMLMEGVVLYIVLVKVFTRVDWKYYTGFTLLCYGGPLLYMIMCVPLGLARTNEWSYGSDDVCWLTYDDQFIWAFIVPVVVIIVINLGFLIMAIRIMWKHNRNSSKSKVENTWYWFKGSFSLMISMGVTWIFGLLSFHEFLLPFIYLFAIFTSLQGLWIFLLFVVLSHPVRESSKKMWYSTVGSTFSGQESTYSFRRNSTRTSSFLSTRANSVLSKAVKPSEISISIDQDEKSADSSSGISSGASSKDSILKYERSPRIVGRLSASPDEDSASIQS
ncbi:adhesion G protein-coupled receptor E3-like isoform X2 [Dysidea avara]